MPYHYSNLNLVQMKKKSIAFVVVFLLEENRDHLHWSRLEIIHEKLISHGTNTKVGVGGGSLCQPLTNYCYFSAIINNCIMP